MKAVVFRFALSFHRTQWSTSDLATSAMPIFLLGKARALAGVSATSKLNMMTCDCWISPGDTFALCSHLQLASATPLRRGWILRLLGDVLKPVKKGEYLYKKLPSHKNIAKPINLKLVTMNVGHEASYEKRPILPYGPPGTKSSLAFSQANDRALPSSVIVSHPSSATRDDAHSSCIANGFSHPAGNSSLLTGSSAR